MERETGGPVSDVDPKSYDDKLLNLVAGNPLHMFKFSKRASMDLPNIVEILTNIEGNAGLSRYFPHFK